MFYIKFIYLCIIIGECGERVYDAPKIPFHVF